MSVRQSTKLSYVEHACWSPAIGAARQCVKLQFLTELALEGLSPPAFCGNAVSFLTSSEHFLILLQAAYHL